MKTILDVLDELLCAYERSTPCINQSLVRRVLAARAAMRRMLGLGLAVGVAFIVACSAPAMAYNTNENPDRYPSLGFDLIKGQQQGIPRAGVNDMQTNGGMVGARADYRLPISNAFTFHFAAESLGVNNNAGFTDGYRVELGGRIYFHD